MECININDANLRFTSNISQHTVDFLDVRILVKQGKIATTLHRKSAAGNSTLHASSAHLWHIIKNIPYGELLHIRKICSTEEELEKSTQQALSRFKNRGYNEKVLKEAEEKVKGRSRCSLNIDKKNTTRAHENKRDEKIEDTTPRFITTFNKQERKVRSILTRNWPILLTDGVLALCFRTTRLLLIGGDYPCIIRLLRAVLS